MQANPVATGTLLQNRYRLVGIGSQGVFGQTYLARDQLQQNELCVLKEFLPAEPDPESLQTLWHRFNQGAAILYSLQHAQLPSQQALLLQGNRFFWVREYIEGKSYGVLLEERREDGQAFSELEVLELMGQVLPVLHYLHGRGVIHRNVTPDSLILREGDGLPVLVNFGLIYELVAQLQLHPVVPEDAIGEWGYAPPEQVARTPCPASDLFALAVTVVVLLAGKTPEELYDPETQIFDWESQVSVSSGLKQLLWQMLNVDTQKRPASALVVMQAIQPLLARSLQMRQIVQKQVVVPPPELEAEPRPRKPRQQPRSAQRGKPRSAGADLAASMLLGMGMTLLFAVIGWRVVTTGFSLPFFKKTSETTTTSPSPSATPLVPEQAEQPLGQPTSEATPAPIASATTGTDALRDRRRTLGIDYNFFTRLVDEQFYEKYPQLRSQTLSDEAQQASLKNEWNAIATSLMDRLEKLSPASRGKLGSYSRADYQQWLTELGETGETSKTLDPVADAQFYQLFPELRGKTLSPKTFGQVWYAIAEDQMASLRSRTNTAAPRPTSAQ